jgi:2-polyprenyl-3-methyl-5-hydroxy-6-metoxy-1,4-benzoquinol methylase
VVKICDRGGKKMNDTSKHLNTAEVPPHLEVFFEMLNVPIYCNLLWSEREAAINCPKGDIKLVFNHDSGLIYNAAFDATKLDYDRDYENSLHYSPRFQQYAQALAEDLVKRYQLDRKDIIEIGCGKGDFLISLCELSNSKGVGFDPTYVPRSEHEHMSEQVKIIQDYYSDKYQDYQADLICCRHTLEHILNPDVLLGSLRQAIGSRLNTAVFFEVPNGLHTFRNMAIWDIIYEHCCYFVPTSLVTAFRANSFAVKDVRETFDGQFLCIDALPVLGDGVPNNSSDSSQELKTLKKDLDEFAQKFQDIVTTWQDNLAKIARKGKGDTEESNSEACAARQKAVVWGAGSKGVTFLNIFKDRGIEYIVDLNPRKQGMYLPGSGQKIVPPEFLKDYQPDVVIVMNPIYEDEIRNSIASLGVDAEIICV